MQNLSFKIYHFQSANKTKNKKFVKKNKKKKNSK